MIDLSRGARHLLVFLGMLVYHLGLSRLVIWRQRRSPKVILYHACEEVESTFIRGLRSNTHPDTLALHLDFLKEHYSVVPLHVLEDGPVPDRAVVITFDDGYLSVFDNAYPLLRDRGLPSTVYVVTGVIGNQTLVWVNELNWYLHEHPDVTLPIAQRLLGVPGDLRSPRDIVLFTQTNFDARATEEALSAMARALDIDRGKLAREAELFVTEADLREMGKGGVTVGNHTARHPNLSCLEANAQRQEMLEGLLAVNGLGGGRSLAYPFGAHNAASEREARELGHTSIMLIGGVNRPGLEKFRIGRISLSSTSRAGLFAELEVVEPLKASIRKLISWIPAVLWRATRQAG